MKKSTPQNPLIPSVIFLSIHFILIFIWVFIIKNTNSITDPKNYITITDSVYSIFGYIVIIWLFLIYPLWISYRIMRKIPKEYRNYIVLIGLYARKEYRNIVVAKFEEKISWRAKWNTKHYYIYHCKDALSGKIYKADTLRNINDVTLSIWDTVQLYLDMENPMNYWVDLSNPGHGTWKKHLSQKEIEKWEEKIYESKKSVENLKFTALHYILIFSILSLISFITIYPDLKLYLTWIQTTGRVINITTENEIHNKTRKHGWTYSQEVTKHNIEIALIQYLTDAAIYSEKNFNKKELKYLIKEDTKHPIWNKYTYTNTKWINIANSISDYKKWDEITLIVGDSNLLHQSIIFNDSNIEIYDDLLFTIKYWLLISLSCLLGLIVSFIFHIKNKCLNTIKKS